MGKRSDYDEGYEDARRDMVGRKTGSRRGRRRLHRRRLHRVRRHRNSCLIIAYVVLRIVGAIQGAF